MYVQELIYTLGLHRPDFGKFLADFLSSTPVVSNHPSYAAGAWSALAARWQWCGLFGNSVDVAQEEGNLLCHRFRR